MAITAPPFSDARAAFRTERAARHPRPARTPLLVRLARFAARRLPTFAQARRVTLSLGGFACLTAAAWTIAVPAGLAVGGVSLLVLEWLAGDQ